MIIKEFPSKIKFETSDEKLTNNLGVLSLVGLSRKHSLFEYFEDHLLNYLSNRAFEPYTYPFTHMANKWTGGVSLKDSRTVSEDQVLVDLITTKGLPKPNTLSDYFNQVKGRDAHRVRKKNRAMALEILDQREKKEICIDIDAKVHASDNQKAKMSYKGFRGYCPLYATLPDEKLVFDAYFRQGNASPARNNESMVRTTLKEMPERINQIEFTFDNAGCQVGVIDALMQADQEPGRRVKFYTRPAKPSDNPHKKLRKRINKIDEEDWLDMDKDANEGLRQIAETTYTISNATGSKECRLVVIRELVRKAPRFQKTLIQVYKYSSYLTNDWTTPCKQIPEKYNRRGAAEDLIGEVVEDGNQERFPVGSDAGNALILSLNVLTHNLIQELKDKASTTTERIREEIELPKQEKEPKSHSIPDENWSSFTPTSVRKRLINVAIRVVHHARYQIIKLDRGFPWSEIIEEIIRACWVGKPESKPEYLPP